MTNKKITCIVIAGIFAAAFVMASCEKFDVVGKDSVDSFDKVLQQAPQSVSADPKNGGWSLAAPDKSARFIWSRDYTESPLHDVMIEFDAAPFIAAGLDPEKLPEHIAYYDGMLMVGRKLGDKPFKYSGTVSPITSYEQIVKENREAVGYHGALDHYGVNLGDGNLFEWAKDMNTNDKDIVFVLNPAPFIAAGVNPEKINGWLFAQVIVDDENGKAIEVDKILKPFNLR
ncbi:MAG: hypothetical protein LBV68_00840 [Spirochaetaceae bacterium]|jgi:hypothetical protein|nr:hypothetical protein [Spirochaetaceae bacterium]